MKNDIGTVIGIVRGISKDGLPFTKLSLTGEYDDYVKNCTGNDVQQVYVKKPLEVKMGNTVELVYARGYEDKAYVKTVNVLK